MKKLKLTGTIFSSICLLVCLTFVGSFAYAEDGEYVNREHQKEGHYNNDTIGKYLDNISSFKTSLNFTNDLLEAKPQTYMYDLITNHFKEKNANGKKKKLMVIGYDGCRLDALTLATKKSGPILRLVNQYNGESLFTYCGADEFPKLNIVQETSTAPGWLSMLTGCVAIPRDGKPGHGIVNNGQHKNDDPRSLFVELVEDNGDIYDCDSSGFYVSWKGHFTNDNATYVPDKEYTTSKESLKDKVHWERKESDEANCENIVNVLGEKNCPDFMFSIFEYCDHAGHDGDSIDEGFNLASHAYTQAFQNSEDRGNQIMDKIINRPTFNDEDWLVIVTADHGGYGRIHGRYSAQTRYTFITSAHLTK